jgi:MFS family permease
MSDVGRRPNVLVGNRPFRRLWTARAISFIGDGVAITALVLHIESANGTGTAVGALLLAQALPHLIGPLAGVVSDRTDQRRLMIWCDLGRAAIFGVAAWLLPPLSGLLALVASASFLDTLFVPAGRSAIPAMVDEEDLLSANAWMGTALNMQVAIGPLLGGLFVATLGTRGALAADAASFLLSAAVLLSVPKLPPVRRRSERATFWGDTREGLAYVRQHAVARAIVITLFLGVAFAGVDNVALVFLTRQVLGAGPLGYGVVGAAFGIGMLAVSVFLSRRREGGVSPRTLFLGSWLLTAAGALLTGIAPALWLVAGAQMIGGLGNGAGNVASDTLTQRNVSRDMLGRVFGVTSTAAFIGGGIAYPVGGRLLDATSPRFVFVLAAFGVLAVVGLGVLMLPKER